METGSGGSPAALLREAVRLQREGEPFALATVVRAERPTSARPGAKAIVREDGEIRGFVGGACVRPSVRREALASLEDGRPRLLRISPDAPAPGAPAPEGVLEEVMACVSGGTLDIHIEPCLPAPRLVVYGDSPVAAACRRLGETLGYEVQKSVDARAPGACAGAVVVVAAHGSGELAVLRAALSAGRAAWVGLIASPRRAASVRRSLRATALSEREIGRLRSPAGLDIGAESPGEIALSIFAQVIAERRQAAGEREAAALPKTGPARPSPPVGIELGSPPAPEQVDPICGMTVRADSPHRFERDGDVVLFCCSGCLAQYRATA